MKKLEIILRPEKLEDLKCILNDYAIGGITVSSVMGCGKQKGEVDGGEFKGLKITGMNLLPKIQAVAVVDDDVAGDILNTVHEKISSGRVGDGKVFVSQIEDVMRIRTGERGKKAL